MISPALAARPLARHPRLSLDAAVVAALEAHLGPAHSVAVGIHRAEGGLTPAYGGAERGER